MKELNVMLLLLGSMILAIGLFSGMIKTRLYVSAPLCALLFGILIGPYGLHWISPEKWPHRLRIVEELARLTLGIALVAVALRIPEDFWRRYWPSILLILGIVMPLMFIAGGLLTYAFLGTTFWVAMLIGAVITPTDPVVASAIVTGKLADNTIPGRLRHFLSAESGSNDGLAYFLVYLPMLMLDNSLDTTIKRLIVGTLLWEVGVAVVLGAFIGYASGKLLLMAKKRNLIEKTSMLGISITLSMISLGGSKIIHTDGIFAVFVAGVAFNWVIKSEERLAEENVQEAINHFFTLPAFTVLGIVLPFSQWAALGFPAILLCLAVLAFRRLPTIYLFSSFLRPLQSPKDRWLMGWFGPMGISSLYYSAYALRKTGIEEIFAVGTLVICSSILAHGISATPLTRIYAKAV